MAKRNWNELTPTQQRAIAVAGFAQFALQAFVLRDLKRRDDAEVRGSKRLWRALSFVNFAGPIAYLALGRKSAS
jgi:hypothetical protein